MSREFFYSKIADHLACQFLRAVAMLKFSPMVDVAAGPNSAHSEGMVAFGFTGYTYIKDGMVD